MGKEDLCGMEEDHSAAVVTVMKRWKSERGNQLSPAKGVSHDRGSQARGKDVLPQAPG